MQGGGIGICAQFGAYCCIAHRARHKRQRLEMLDTRIDGREQRKDQIHRLPVDRIEIQRFFQPQEGASDMIKPDYAGMWQGNAVSDASWSKAFSLQQGIDHIVEVKSERDSGNLSQILEKTFLAGRFACNLDGRRFQYAR